MSDNLKIQNIENIMVGKSFFYYMIFKSFGALSNQGLCHLCWVANTSEYFSETKFRKKTSKFLVYGKTPIIQFSYMEKGLS